MIKLHFTDFFNVKPDVLDAYGAFNISLLNDLPLFIDPFLLFNNPKYVNLHDEIIRYMVFLRNRALAAGAMPGEIVALYTFSEVRQNWLGYSSIGNGGRGLGLQAASSMRANLSMFPTFGQSSITRSSHIEQLSLVADGIGRDIISDFTTNLIKWFLLEYTQGFAMKHLKSIQVRKFGVKKVRFNFQTQTWMSGTYTLPSFGGSFILLTPKEILTKDKNWINKLDLYSEFEEIVDAISNEELRHNVNNYFRLQIDELSPNPRKKEVEEVITDTIRHFPQVIEYYVMLKEENGEEAVMISGRRVAQAETLFVKEASVFADLLARYTDFFAQTNYTNTYDETRARIMYMKKAIENNDGYRIFYDAHTGAPIEREVDLDILFRMVWCGSPSDFNTEVNNGRGPVDAAISRGSKDKTLVEFKLASNSHLKKNLQHQTPIYEQASGASKTFKVIIYFTEQEMLTVKNILRELQLEDDKTIILIDARRDNKPSASVATTH